MALPLTCSGFPSLFQSHDIPLENIHFVKTTLQAIDEASVEFSFRPRERIMLPQPISPDLDKPGVAQIGQMPRHLGLGQLQNIVNIADAELPPRQHMQDAQAGLIGKTLKHAIYSGMGNHLYIRLGVYSSTSRVTISSE